VRRQLSGELSAFAADRRTRWGSDMCLQPGSCLQEHSRTAGDVAYERFKEARQAGQPSEVLLGHLNAAFETYQEALQMFPSDAVNELAVTHNALGVIHWLMGRIEQAVIHYRESIRCDEMQGNLYRAALTRENVAMTCANVRRFEDALLFAQAALHTFEQFGPAAAADMTRAQELIAKIEQAARAKAGG
jgi:tetratricopeptide (TPR) repeat protein